MDQEINLIAELAPELSVVSAEVPYEQSLANSSLAKTTGKTGNPAISGKAEWGEIVPMNEDLQQAVY